MSHIALPQAEDLIDQVVLKEFHAGQHVEHGRLLHPVGKSQELGRHGVLALLLGGLDLDDTLC